MLSFAGLAGIWVLRPRKDSFFKVRLFVVCEIAKATFLFHVAETKLYQIILWRIRFLLSSLVGSLKWVCLLTLAYQGVDGVTRRYVTCVVHARGSQNNLPIAGLGIVKW